MSPATLGASSWWGPALVLGGAGSLGLAAWWHGHCGHATVLPAEPEAAERPPRWWERISVHLLVYGLWAVGFGAVIWRGAPANLIDVRCAAERTWPVWEAGEWIYLSVYVVPALIPWCAPTRESLRRYSWGVLWLLLVSLPLFLLLPFGSPPRPFTPTSRAGEILLWETSRPDFAAAALPSFHAFWGLLVAQALTARGCGWGVVGLVWAVAVSGACVATGAHAVVDVVASWLLFPLLTARSSPVARKLQARADRRWKNSTAATPSNPPTSAPPPP